MKNLSIWKKKKKKTHKKVVVMSMVSVPPECKAQSHVSLFINTIADWKKQIYLDGGYCIALPPGCVSPMLPI
jgi:hypothetical protein